MAYQGITDAQKAASAQRSKDCTEEAIFAACKSGALALGISSGLGFMLHTFNEAFRKRFTVGAKTCFVVMPAFYAFYLESERSLWRCSRRQANQFMKPVNMAETEDSPR